MQQKNAAPRGNGPTWTKLVGVMAFALALGLYLWTQIFSFAKDGPKAVPLIIFTGILGLVAFGTFFGTLAMARAKRQGRSRAT